MEEDQILSEEALVFDELLWALVHLKIFFEH